MFLDNLIFTQLAPSRGSDRLPLAPDFSRPTESPFLGPSNSPFRDVMWNLGSVFFREKTWRCKHIYIYITYYMYVHIGYTYIHIYIYGYIHMYHIDMYSIYSIYGCHNLNYTSWIYFQWIGGKNHQRRPFGPGSRSANLLKARALTWGGWKNGPKRTHFFGAFSWPAMWVFWGS